MSEQIAVIRFSSLGDILCTGPAVRSLRRQFPEASISFITTTPYEELAGMLPGVDDVIALPPRGREFGEQASKLAGERRWDSIADLQGSPRSNRLVKLLNPQQSVQDTPPRLRRTLFLLTRLKAGRFPSVPDRMRDRLEGWGCEDDGGSLSVEVPEDARTEVLDRWGAGADDAILLVPGAKHNTKRWPGVYWVELVRTLPRSRTVIVIGANGDMPPALSDMADSRVLDLCGETSIPETAALMERAAVVVSGDTGPMHLAVATGTPVVALFGPTVREFGFYPYRHSRAEVLERPLACRPCSAHGGARCPLGHHSCLREIYPAHVRRAVERAIGPDLFAKSGTRR